MTLEGLAPDVWHRFMIRGVDQQIMLCPLAGTDLFPSGKFPVSGDTYGSVRCFLVPLSEKSGNPNY